MDRFDEGNDSADDLAKVVSSMWCKLWSETNKSRCQNETSRRRSLFIDEEKSNRLSNGISTIIADLQKDLQERVQEEIMKGQPYHRKSSKTHLRRKSHSSHLSARSGDTQEWSFESDLVQVEQRPDCVRLSL
jgi:hypothetical protein